MVRHRFHKLEGLANDFVVVDGRWETVDADEQITWWQRRVERLCHRRLGVGGDGLLLVLPARETDAAARMVVLNSDGSRPEMCGNGIRCVALYLATSTEPGARVFAVETDAGRKLCELDDVQSASAMVRVAMGPSRLTSPSPTPVAADGRSFISVDMGNPHAVTFAAAQEDIAELARTMGPPIAVDSAYPRGTNVEFCRVHTDGSIDVAVWERGVGITQACGTGACAAAVAAVARKLVPSHSPISVTLPGGTLAIEVPSRADDDVYMRGPATHVFSGDLDLH